MNTASHQGLPVFRFKALLKVTALSAGTRLLRTYWGLFANKSALLFLKGNHKKASMNGLSSALTRRKGELCCAERLYFQLQGNGTLPVPLSQCCPACPARCWGVSAFLAHTVLVVTSALTHSTSRGQASRAGEESGVDIAAACRRCSSCRHAISRPCGLPARCFALLGSVRSSIACYFKQRLYLGEKNKVVVKF